MRAFTTFGEIQTAMGLFDFLKGKNDTAVQADIEQ